MRNIDCNYKEMDPFGYAGRSALTPVG